MTRALLDLVAASYPLKELDVGEFSRLKVRGMTFSVRAFEASGLGRVSLMQACGFFGLMKMDTIMITPTETDLPLYSYDRIYAMGNDTLIVELYDTLTGVYDEAPLLAAKATGADLPERDPGVHWYDPIKLASSISKKGKKQDTPRMDALALMHLLSYLRGAAPVTDTEKKAEKTAAYVNGLLKQGGPSTDAFLKAIGEEKTACLFRRVLFGIA